ncbi:MAG: NADH-quinone oxidoreductase subunit L [Acidobacteria bacterium]|nr:NADH-quinone oxidoreductase subunit L [Acidobacteriota bacterium]
MNIAAWAWLIPVLPLAGFFFNLVLGKKAGKGAVTAAGVGTVALAFVLSLIAFKVMLAAPGHRLEIGYGEWMSAGAFSVPMGFVVDPLSGIMMLVITGIGALIHLYSVGYMAEDKGYGRYFAYMNLFVFFMLLLVMGSSLPLLFVGWEGVGLCSYLLIGYDFAQSDDVPPQAGLKAFLYNRVGDLGVLMGMFALFAVFGTLTIGDILVRAGHLAPGVGLGLLTFATLMFFLGCAGKSAQLPLYLWLPDAMAGPTPVSALIHAATMVTSGIYLVVRMAPLLQMTPVTMNVIAWVGGGTALFAATIAIAQKDIKRVLAYSTVSQLGYMFLGLGAAGFAAGFFHVFTHAWFKALLFLGAGSVIHALHHEQSLMKMGGLWKKMPITAWTMLIATACIIGFPGTSGFASKDEILYLAYLKSPVLYWMGVAGACCTAFYMLRLFTLAFLGEARDAHAYEHAHESPRTMTVPLVILAIGALAATAFGWPTAFGGSFRIEAFLEPSVRYGQSAMEAVHHGGSPALLATISTVLALAFAYWGWSTYRNGLAVAEARAAKWPFLHRLLENKYFVDEGVDFVLIRPLRWFGNLLWKLFDVIFIDGIGVNLPGALTRVAGDFIALFQTGRVRNYVLTMGLGALLLLYVFLK